MSYLSWYWKRQRLYTRMPLTYWNSPALKAVLIFEIQERLRAEAEKQAVQFDSQKPMIDDGWMKHDETISCYINLQLRFQRPQGVVWEDNNNSIWDVHEDFYSCITACWDERSPSIATSHVLIVQLALIGLFFSKRGCDMLQKKPALKGRTSVVPSFSMIGGGVDGIPKSFKVSSFCPNSCHGGVLHGLGCGLTVSPREVPENVSTKYCQYKIYLELQTTILM